MPAVAAAVLRAASANRHGSDHDLARRIPTALSGRHAAADAQPHHVLIIIN
jgi:hypothetical protein